MKTLSNLIQKLNGLSRETRFV